MHHFTSDIIQALVKKEDVSEIFGSHLEDAVNTLLKTELTAFLDYEKYDRPGFNSGNSRNGDYTRTLHAKYGDLELKIPQDRKVILSSRRLHHIKGQMIRWSRLSSTCFKKASLHLRLPI